MFIFTGAVTASVRTGLGSLVAAPCVVYLRAQALQSFTPACSVNTYDSYCNNAIRCSSRASPLPVLGTVIYWRGGQCGAPAGALVRSAASGAARALWTLP